MTAWTFEELPMAQVEQDLTQRDQFNNDEVELSEALIREVIQNSTDAAIGGTMVKVRFAIRDLDAGGAAVLRSRFASLRPHLAQCAISANSLDRNHARVLVIEDFGTRGLTGNPGALDGDNFHNFWRRHGRSGKGGNAGGRWGLGKLVFSGSSEIRAFFGLTLRSGDTSPLLLGQAVLRNHEIGGKRYLAHGFWFSERNSEGLQMPVTDAAEISSLTELSGVMRSGQPGLSLIIPYLNLNVTESTIISAVVRNYYFPILAGHLVVEVGSTLIDRKTFHQVADSLSGGHGIAIPLQFVEEVSAQLQQTPSFLAASAMNGRGLEEKSFSGDDIAAMKKSFSENSLIHARVRVKLKPAGGGERVSHVDLFLKSVPETDKPFALFVRGSITVPGEMRYFSGAHAWGAMIAADGGVVAFLGDAENPAHTAWNANAERLSERWKLPSPTLKHIRHALRELYGCIADQIEREDRNALIDLFSLADHTQSSAGKKKRSRKPDINAVPREKAISIKPRKGGFQVVAGPGAAKWTFPKMVRVRVAYDLIGANPFNRHSKFDFDLTKGGIDIEACAANVDPVKPNTLDVQVTGPDFSITAHGFDENRDIVVDARAA